MNIKRRTFIKTTGAAVVGMSLPTLASASEIFKSIPKHQICLFSKHLQYLDFQEMSEIIARTGFDGIDLTVRPGGHIEPETVEIDLPKVIKAAQSSGLTIPMMTTNISDPDDAISKKVLEVAANNGVKYYRMGSMKYDHSISIEANLKKFRKVFEKFEAINQHYSIHGDFQNHWGSRFGAPIWDLYQVLNGLDPQWIGSQYDIRHAVVEGGGSWILGMKALAPYISSTAMKDFIWVKDKNWQPRSVPLGTGMVDFDAYFEEYKKLKNTGPISLHYEYGMGNTKERKGQDMTDAKIVEFYKTDLDELKKRMIAAGLR
jgi:L-ribulose-5-phosphate 3-epimerase